LKKSQTNVHPQRFGAAAQRVDDLKLSHILNRGLLDHNSPIPLYYQLAHTLEDCLTRDPELVGVLLPSEEQLSHVLGISRPTVR
jgi:hypothetical protein